MNAKYYTPEIEEFHVGFEYEVKDYTTREWKKKTLIATDSEDVNNSYIPRPKDLEEYFRVKYLDKEDIESLGFVLTQNLTDDFEFEWHIVRKDGSSVGTFLDDSILSREMNIEFYSTHFLIKNKSELKRLMKQLGLLCQALILQKNT